MSFTRLLLASTALCLASAAHAEDWRLAKDEEGIKVYLSEVAGSPYKAYRGAVSYTHLTLPTKRIV